MQSFPASAPGRVNLIGEHTDYNGGLVLPAALSVSLGVELTLRTDKAVLVTAEGYAKTSARELSQEADGSWSDPALGAVREANALGLLQGGVDLAISSSIPEGSGLSSSAALIVAILKAARAANGGGPSDVDLAIAARRVENDFIGVPCGIMDQMAVALAKPGSAMALNTSTLEFNLVELPKTHKLIVIHSGLTRKLTDGRYAERKIECDTAKAYFETNDLCLLSLSQVEAADLPDQVKRRARHCVTEQARVLSAVKALKAGDIEQLGQEMSQSHISMRDDFEMSLPEIDALVETAQEYGAIGARLTGGGFGGCIVACVEKGRSDDWLEAVLSRHKTARFIDAVAG